MHSSRMRTVRNNSCLLVPESGVLGRGGEEVVVGGLYIAPGYVPCVGGVRAPLGGQLVPRVYMVLGAVYLVPGVYVYLVPGAVPCPVGGIPCAGWGKCPGNAHPPFNRQTRVQT